MLVWVDAWQHECCGDPFTAGDRVGWRVAQEVDRDWLADLLGSERAGSVDGAESRHADVNPLTWLNGTVRRIWWVDRPVGVGRGVENETREAPRWRDPSEADGLVGYLVELSDAAWGPTAGS